jgi:hypothetical protein
MGAPTSSYATAGIGLRVSGALKPHYRDKVETPSMGKLTNGRCIIVRIESAVKYATHNLPSTMSRPTLVPTESPIQAVPVVKRARIEADHSPPSSAETRMVELYFHSSICLHGVVLN